MTRMKLAYRIKPTVFYRSDPGGGLAWTAQGAIHKLSVNEAICLILLSKPRSSFNISNLLGKQDSESIISKLLSIDVIEASNDFCDQGIYECFADAVSDAVTQSISGLNKPFWAHLQPFTFCNLNCLHCYCNSGPLAEKLILKVDQWKSIIDKLVKFGVIEIYVTGGENFLVEEYFELTDYILAKGCITGLSTNATHINEKILNFLSSRDIQQIQVSLDGASEQIHDYIRGKQGAFNKTIKGICKLSESFDIVLNTVVNRYNVSDIENIILLGKKYNISLFKFFPQKPVGRAKNIKSSCLDFEEWKLINFKSLESIHDVSIDFLNESETCGSGHSGFAINERGDLFPCIFGTHNPETKFGNILESDIEHLWYNSPHLIEFRKAESCQPCSRCH